MDLFAVSSSSVDAAYTGSPTVYTGSSTDMNGFSPRGVGSEGGGNLTVHFYKLWRAAMAIVRSNSITIEICGPSWMKYRISEMNFIISKGIFWITSPNSSTISISSQFILTTFVLDGLGRPVLVHPGPGRGGGMRSGLHYEEVIWCNITIGISEYN